MKFGKVKVLSLIGILICYSFLLSRFFDYVTIWDAQTNTGLVIEAAKKSLNLFNLEINSHPNQAYFLPQLALQYINPGSMLFFHLIDVIFGIVMICAFYGILLHLTPNAKYFPEVILTTFLFAFYPVFTSNALSVIYDFALTAYMLVSLYFLLKKRYLLAAIFGTGQLFSKEPGIAIYGVILVVYYLFFIRNKTRIGTYISRIRLIILLFSPYILFGIYAISKKILFPGSTFFFDKSNIFMTGVSYRSLWPTWEISKVRLSSFVTIFIMNFNWILTVIVLLGLVRLLWFLISKRGLIPQGIDLKKSAFISTLFIPVLGILTYVRIFTNPRYFMPIYALLILNCFIAMYFIENMFTRRIVLIGVIIIFYLSNFYTFDPVSKKIYGTFQFGNHDMLKMTSITGECCGYGRDQLVYNLQFTYIERLTNKIFEFYKPTEKTAFAMDRLVGNIFSLSISKTTYRRTWRNQNVFIPYDISWTFLNPAYPKPEVVHYIDYPFVGKTDTLAQFQQFYKITGAKLFEMDGYTLPVYTMEKKT